MQTYNSEFHVAGSPANAENKGQVAAGVLLSLCSDCVQISCIKTLDLTRFHRFFPLHWSRLIDSGAADDTHAPEISGDAAGAPTSIIDA